MTYDLSVGWRFDQKAIGFPGLYGNAYPVQQRFHDQLGSSSYERNRFADRGLSWVVTTGKRR